MEKFGKFTFGLITYIAHILINGFMIMKFWGWFIVPVFQVQYLHFSGCIGLGVFVIIFKTHKREPEKKFKELVEDTFYYTTFDVILLLVGWIVYLFIK